MTAVLTDLVCSWAGFGTGGNPVFVPGETCLSVADDGVTYAEIPCPPSSVRDIGVDFDHATATPDSAVAVVIVFKVISGPLYLEFRAGGINLPGSRGPFNMSSEWVRLTIPLTALETSSATIQQRVGGGGGGWYSPTYRGAQLMVFPASEVDHEVVVHIDYMAISAVVEPTPDPDPDPDPVPDEPIYDPVLIAPAIDADLLDGDARFN